MDKTIVRAFRYSDPAGWTMEYADRCHFYMLHRINRTTRISVYGGLMVSSTLIDLHRCSPFIYLTAEVGSI